MLNMQKDTIVVYINYITNVKKRLDNTIGILGKLSNYNEKEKKN